MGLELILSLLSQDWVHHTTVAACWWMEPDRPGYHFRASKSRDQGTLCSSELRKGRSGVLHQHRFPIIIDEATQPAIHQPVNAWTPKDIICEQAFYLLFLCSSSSRSNNRRLATQTKLVCLLAFLGSTMHVHITFLRLVNLILIPAFPD